MITLEQLKESSFYQLALEEGIERGIERGIEKGIERGIEKGIERGIERGIEKGIEKGWHDGEAALLRRLLERRFGALPEWAVDKIQAADQETIEQWGMRVLDATSLESVLSLPN